MITLSLYFLYSVSGNFGHLLPNLETFEIGLQNTRIVGGVDAPETGIPYQVSLRNIFNLHFCGGSILSERWILTAAHCTLSQKYSRITAVVGTNSLQYGGERYSAETIIEHENYNSAVIMNDVSVIRVARDIEFSEKVQPIKLPEHNTDVGTDLLLSGWGRLSYPGLQPVHLQMINVTSLSVENCQEWFGGINQVFDSQICSLTRAGEGACYGDSGGPLVEGDNIVGIVSWGMPCARGFPDVFTRVYSFREWIREKITTT